MQMTTTTTVSVPSHLHSSLAALLERDILSEPLSSSLQAYIKPSLGASATEIPYDTLRQISQWALSELGKTSLKKNNLDLADYSMIAMLSGTLSSPSAKLAPYKRPLTAEEAAMVRSKERKAISAVLNGFLSTVAVGVAMWWLGGSISMRTDYKAFLSVLSAIVVAATEAILYWIWQWRYKKALNSQSKRVMAQRKKIDIVGQDEIQDEAPQEAVGVITTALESGTESGARKRRGPGATETSA